MLPTEASIGNAAGVPQRQVDAARNRFLPAIKAALTATLTEAIVLVSMNVLAVYDRLKSARAALDYDDLIARTLALLDKKEAAQWVLYKLDGGIDQGQTGGDARDQLANLRFAFDLQTVGAVVFETRRL